MTEKITTAKMLAHVKTRACKRVRESLFLTERTFIKYTEKNKL